VGEDLVRNFPDVLYVQLVRVLTDKGDEVSKHKFLFNPKVSAEAKDLNGKITKVSFSNFAPRISYFKRDDLPHDSEVDIAKILLTLDAYVVYKPFKDYTHPNPKTYLNQERWNDELEPVRKFNPNVKATININ